jgi:hypothetical protein
MLETESLGCRGEYLSTMSLATIGPTEVMYGNVDMDID